MKHNLESSLNSYYEQFSVGHEQRRSQLLRSMSGVRHEQMQEPAAVGASSVAYDVLRSSDPADFDLSVRASTG